MLQTWIHRIKPSKEARLRAWLAELEARTDEVRQSLDAAGVRAEQAFVVPGATGPLLIYINELDDVQRANDVFAASELAIDVTHREVMLECVEETLDVRPEHWY